MTEPAQTFTTSEAAERIGVKSALLATRLTSGAHWRWHFDIPNPGSGNRRRLTARDVVVAAALHDWTDPRRRGYPGGTAVIGEPLRSDLIAEIRRVPWGEEVVTSSLYNDTMVSYTPRWHVGDAAAPEPLGSLGDPTDG